MRISWRSLSMRSTVGGQRTSLFAQACIASCSYYSLSSYVALFQSGVCSLAFIVPFPPIPYGNRYLLFIGFCYYLLPIVFPLKFLFQCDRCRGSLWLWGARGWVAGRPRYWVVLLPGARAARVSLPRAPNLHFCD